MNIEHHATRV